MATHHLNIIITISIITTLLLPGTIEGIQLGSLAKSTHIEVAPGERATFTILLWTMEDPFPITFSLKNAPEEFTVIIFPKEFELNKTPVGKTETLLIPQREHPVQAQIIDIYIDVPHSTEEGTYDVVVNALAGNEGEQIAVLQERSFHFTIEVVRKSFSHQNEIGSLNPLTKFLDDINKGITGLFIDKSGNISSASFILIIILIFFIAWRIYRHG